MPKPDYQRREMYAKIRSLANDILKETSDEQLLFSLARWTHTDLSQIVQQGIKAECNAIQTLAAFVLATELENREVEKETQATLDGDPHGRL